MKALNLSDSPCGLFGGVVCWLFHFQFFFFFFFSSFLRAEGKWKNQGCVQAAAVNREPKGVLVGLNLAQWGSSRLALLLPGVRIRPTEARALLRGARLARRYAEGHEVDVRMSRRARSTPV